MGLFAKPYRRAMAATPKEPGLSQGIIIGLLVAILAMGYLVESEAELSPMVLAIGAALGLMALFFASFKRADLPLYVMVAYLPFSKLLSGDFGGFMTAFNLTNILLVLLFCSWLSSGNRRGAKWFEPHILHLPVFLLAFWGILMFLQMAIFSGGAWYVSKYINEFKRWLDPIIVYFLFFHLVRDKQRWRNVVLILMIGVTVVALMAINDYMGVKAGTSLDKARIGGIAGQPNILGAFFVYYMFLFASFGLRHIRSWKGWGFFGLFLLCFRGIMVTFSRGAYLAFAQGMLGFTYFKHKALALCAVALLALAYFNPQVLPSGIRYRLDSTFKNNQTTIVGVYGNANLEEELDSSSSTRLEIWRNAMIMIRQHPWTGVGFGMFAFNMKFLMPMHRWIDAHNAYIITAAEMGIPALVFFLLVILVVFRVTYVVSKLNSDPFIRTTALGFLGGLCGLLMANMFGSRLNSAEVAGYFWILVALMARAHLWTKEEQAAERAQIRARQYRKARRGRP